MKKLCTNVRWCGTIFGYVFTFAFYLLFLAGCGPTLSSPEQVKEFEKVGPGMPEARPDRLGDGRFRAGPYQVVCGDLLEFQIPAVLRIVSSDLSGSFEDVEPYLCRVNDSGIIVMPIVGEIPVASRTLAEVESLVVDTYFPKYVVNRPMVVCEVTKYQSENERVFTVMGLVNRPDAFPYPPDVQYNLMEALAFAGGFDLIADPRYVKVYRQDANGKVVSATFGINENSLADAYNVIIKPGDVIFVDHTLRTRTNSFLSNVFRIGVGADARYTR